MTLHQAANMKSVAAEQAMMMNRAAPLRDRFNPDHVREDNELLRKGILDPASYRNGYKARGNPVEVRVYHGKEHPDRTKRDTLKAVRRTHNVRTNLGGTWLQRTFSGLPSGVWPTAQPYTANASSAVSIGVATTPFTAATLVNAPAGAAYNTGQFGVSTGGLVGGIVVSQVAGVYGIITGNTTSTLYVDQWTTIGTAGTVGTTPAATAVFTVLPYMGPGTWIGLTTTALTTSGTPSINTGDTTLPGEIVGVGTNPTGLLRAFVNVAAITNPSTNQTGLTGNVAATLVYTHQFTAGGTGTANIQGCGLYNGNSNATANATATAANSSAWLLFEAALTGANLSGPNADYTILTWTYTLS